MLRSVVRPLLCSLLLLSPATAVQAQRQDAAPLPEAASARQALPEAGWLAERQAVAAAHPLAAEAGLQMLRAGGSALDAAIAAQAVLGLVEPQSSGLGGGALLMHWDGHELSAWDGRETAPAAASPTLFLRADGRPLPMAEAVASGLSVGVPGVLRMLEAVHRQHGRLPWARLFEPAIALAEQGFAVGPRLHRLLSLAPQLLNDPAARAYFFQPAGPGETPQPWPVGHRLRNPAYAELLRRVARDGAEALHRGPAAEAIVRAVRGHPQRPGAMTLQDLAGYRPVQRLPLCSDWRQWRLCGFPPPSSGHLTLMQILGLLEAAPMRSDAPPDEPLHRYLEASKLAFADRARYIADPAFVDPPGGDWQTLLAPGYLRQRAALIGPRSGGLATAGAPAPQRLAWAPQPEQVEQGTSHLSIVDARGQALALTTTIEAGFGSGLLCDGGTGLPGGFLLNNELTDFALQPADGEGRPVANRAEPGKRPRSSMSPTLVFERDSGRLVMTLGSPGGAAIIHFTARTLLATLGQGLSPQAAIAQPHVVEFNVGTSWLERGGFAPGLLEALRARGHRIVEDELSSGLQALRWNARLGRWEGGADPRREGTVAVD